MEVITPGYRYSLASFECDSGQQDVQFVRKELDPETGKFEMRDHGTTNEEVLAMLVHRMAFLQAKSPCKENAMAITKLEEAQMWLQKRTADRVARGVANTPRN